MQFQYEIDKNRGRDNQVGLRLKCVSNLQAQEIYRVLQQHFKAEDLMPSRHPSYTHFTYVTTTEKNLREAMPVIEALYRKTSTAKVAADYVQTEAKAVQNFKSWKSQFRQAVQQLNIDDSPRPTSSVQAIDINYFEQQMRAGRTAEVEEMLLQPTSLHDSNTLRKLIAFYRRTEQNEKVVELCEQRRTEVLALPLSGYLAEQVVSAYLQRYQQTDLPDFLRSAQQIAQEFLPELERLRQAAGVRQLLHQALTPQESLLTETGVTLKEQLAQLVEIEPAERLPKLEFLHQKHPRAVDVILALAASYRTLGNTNQALELYRSVPVKTEAERQEVQQRYVELLLVSDRYQEVIDLLPDENLSPALAGLRGAALYKAGQESQALPFLEQAWQGGERGVTMLLPLARLWATVGDPKKAAEAYEILKDTAAAQLTVEDYAQIAKVAFLDGFGDIPDEEKVSYYEQCINLAGPRLHRLSEAEDILKVRLQLWEQIQDINGLLNAYADLLEWLARAKRLEELDEVLTELRAFTGAKQISRRQHFELLESLEPYVDILPKLRQSLANDYQGIAIAEINNALRQARVEEPFFQDLKRALLKLDRDSIRELVEYRQQCRAEAQELEIQIASEDGTATDTPDLSSLRLALVGGHEATRREVICELREGYGLEDAVEVPPSSEAYVDRSSVQTKINNCDLIAVITGYMGHDLSLIVSDLKKDGALVGEVLPLPCRGKSGVVREILNWWIGR
jgi:thioredoxin-like negative regulator of GroEL